MTPEEIYDAEIAPGLLALCKRCQELGFPFVANVEWQTGETGRTEFCPPTNGDLRPSASQLLVHYAARCRGNVDSFLVAVLHDAEKFGHSSSFLSQLGCPNMKCGAGETAAFAIVSP